MAGDSHQIKKKCQCVYMCLFKMDDIIKRLIYNCKLILFTQSPYIIMPYMCYLQSLSSLCSPQRSVRQSKNFQQLFVKLRIYVSFNIYFFHLSVHECLNYIFKTLVPWGQFAFRHWVLNRAPALKQQFPFSLIIQSASKFGCLAVYLRGVLPSLRLCCLRN